MLTKKEIKDALKDKKVFIGTNSVFKRAKNGKLKAIIYASNCPATKLNNLNKYAAISNIKLEKFNGNSAELGEFCGKPFSILMMGIEK